MGILYVLYVTVRYQQWHQLGHMQTCTSPQTDSHASTIITQVLQAGCLSCHLTNSVKTLKAKHGSDKPTDIGLGAQIR